MTQEITMQAGVELTQVAINPTLNKEQNIFMSTDTITAKPVENAPINAEANTTSTGAAPAVDSDSNKVLQKFINDELTPESLRIYARRELERTQAEQNADLRAKWEKAKKNSRNIATDVRSVEAAIAAGHAPEDITSKGLISQTALEVIENVNLDNVSNISSQRAIELLDKEILTSDEQAEILIAHKERLKKAEEILGGKQLTVEQKLAILKAHYVGLGERGKDGKEGSAGVYNLTPAQLAEKARILEQAGFTEDERREIIESGLTAAAPPPPVGIPPREYGVERNAAIAAFGVLNFNHPELNNIKQKIMDLHNASIAAGGSGIDSESLSGYQSQWANAKEGGRLMGADALLAHEFQERIREIAQLDTLARGGGKTEEAFWEEAGNFQTEIARAHAVGDFVREADLKQQFKLAKGKFVGNINVSETGLRDHTLKYIVDEEEAYQRLAFKIIGGPLQSETGDYSLGFYGQINIDAMTNLLQSLSENTTDLGKRDTYNAQKEDINNIKEGVRTMHELNKFVVTGNLESAQQIAQLVLPKYQQKLQKTRGVSIAERLLEAAHSVAISKEGYISTDTDAEMMGTELSRVTGEFKKNQEGSVLAEFRELVKSVNQNPNLAVGSLSGIVGMEEWEIPLAYNLAKALFNNQQRKAAWTSQGIVPAGNKAYESTPQEGFNKIFNPSRWLLDRFAVGKGRGGMRWFERLMDAMQREKHLEGYHVDSKNCITKIRDDDIKKFELPTLTGVRDWMASWRAVGMTLRQTRAVIELQGKVSGYTVFYKEAGTRGDTIDPTKTTLGHVLDTGALVFQKNGEKDIKWDDAPDQMRADYFRSIFYKPNTATTTDVLRDDLQSALGVIYRFTLAPSGGHHDIEEYKKFNKIKEDIRTKIWERVAKDNPLAIIPYLNKMEYTHNGKTHKTFDGENILKDKIKIDDPNAPGGRRELNVDWSVLQRKLNFLNEIRLAKVRGVKRADGSHIPGQEPVLDFNLQNAIAHVRTTIGAYDATNPANPANMFDLSPDEENYLNAVKIEADGAAHHMANVKFAFAPFINDVLLEDTDYMQPGTESFVRHFRDMAQFNQSNSAVIKAMDNLGQLETPHAMMEFIAEFAKGITGVHGDPYAKEKAYPVIEATAAFFRRGEQMDKEKFTELNKLTVKQKFGRWWRQQDEVHSSKQKAKKANSEAQEYYNMKAASLDRGQMYELMEDLAKAGLMGHDQEEAFMKRFGGAVIEIGFKKKKIKLNFFIFRMILEGIFRGVKGGFLVSGAELFKRSFKGSVQ